MTRVISQQKVIGKRPTEKIGVSWWDVSYSSFQTQSGSLY